MYGVNLFGNAKKFDESRSIEAVKLGPCFKLRPINPKISSTDPGSYSENGWYPRYSSDKKLVSDSSTMGPSFLKNSGMKCPLCPKINLKRKIQSD